MKKLYPAYFIFRAFWRHCLRRCPWCNDEPAAAFTCYVCHVGLIAWRFRWGRWREESNL